MLGKINILTPDIYNKIAAGEVVERPASIVKELVENSVDAGANNISIEIKNGGISYIKVSDNGSGIAASEAAKVFLPHATSKITAEADLYNINTLGFRGEALASIAAVSKVRLLTKTAGEETGAEIRIAGGYTETFPKGSPEGTYILVKDLFYNVPARAKFLKKPKTEEAEIISLVTKLALANPDVAFKLSADGKKILHTSGQGILSVLRTIYGSDITENITEINSTMSDIVLKGYVGKLHFSKPNKTYQTLIINGRYVVNNLLAAAVVSAYADLLMKRQYPFFVLYLNIPVSEIDVNVHPNKLDVRFADSNKVYSFVARAASNAFYEISGIPNVKKSGSREEAPTKTAEPLSVLQIPAKAAQADAAFSYKKNPSLSAKICKEIETEKAAAEVKIMASAIDSHIGTLGKGYGTTEANIYDAGTINRGVAAGAFTVEKNIGLPPDRSLRGAAAPTGHKPKRSAQADLLEARSDAAIQKNADFTVSGFLPTEDNCENKYFIEQQPILFGGENKIGVIFDTYILIEGKDELFLIDQHAAHERVLYDKLTAKNYSGYDQLLLVPYVFEVNHLEREYLLDMLPELNKMGFSIEEFGTNSFKINTVPGALWDIDLKDFVYNLLGDTQIKRFLSEKDLLKEKLAKIACKSAVKGGEKMPDTEIDRLVQILSSGKNIPVCPHGRPIAVKLKRSEIEKWFRRILK